MNKEEEHMPDKRVAERKAALEKEIARTRQIAKIDEILDELTALTSDMGLSVNDRQRVVASVREWRDKELAREPHIPGVNYVRAG